MTEQQGCEQQRDQYAWISQQQRRAGQPGQRRDGLAGAPLAEPASATLLVLCWYYVGTMLVSCWYYVANMLLVFVYSLLICCLCLAQALLVFC